MIRLWAMLAVALGAASAARAADDCAALGVPGAVEAVVKGRTDASAMQAGLRVVFGADSGFLSDGIIGPVTLSFLEQLCRSVPLAEGTERVGGTADLARQYAVLSGLRSGWPGRISDPRLLADAAAPGGHFNRAIVQLAGAPEMAAAALGAEVRSRDCAALADLPIDDAAGPELRGGLTALVAADPEMGPLPPEDGIGREARTALGRVCEAYPTLGGPQAVLASVSRLGGIATAVPGAVGTLGSPGFAAWLAEAPTVRLSRLLGTPPAVVRLLAEYEPQPVVAAAPAAAPLPSCPAPAGDDVPTYLSIEPADLERLTARAGIRAALAPVAAQRFERREDLVAALVTALGVAAPDCGAMLVAAAVARHADGATVYSLDVERVKRLALRPMLGEVATALAPLQELESVSRDELVAGVEAAVRASIDAAVGAAASSAADAAAAAAEDVSPTPDTAVEGIPAPEDAELAESFAITDASIVALQAELSDQAFLDAITASPYRPASTRALVRSDMLAAMHNVVADRSEELTQLSLEEVLPAIRTHWRLDEPVISELAATPEFAAIPPETLQTVAALAGIAYPFPRLFDSALASLPGPVDAAREAILEVARKRVAEPYARRDVAPVAADCGCNVTHRPNSLVYGFYPFWNYAAGDGESPRVDFDLVGRIAFDGLEIGRDAELRYAPQWTDAAATFIASAHRHQAKVDLGIRLRDWREWDEDHVRSAARFVLDELRRSQPVDKLVMSDGLLGWLDPWFDRRADGVTLIVADYDGEPGGGDAQNLVDLVRLISAGLDGTGQDVNLAFDVPLVGSDPAHPLFQDLRGLLVNDTDPEAGLVDHLLVFLERPTTRSKKLLRARIEGSFQGEERIQVLRAVIPVVPPGANALIDHQRVAGLETTTDANSYGQFVDDLVYFQDNFDGIGFWPAPAADVTLPDGSPDRVAELVAARYYAWDLPVVPKRFEPQVRRAVEGACSLVCPNRVAIYLTAVAAAGLGVLVTALSYYSGRTRILARRLLVVPILMLVILGLMAITVTCDPGSRSWSPLTILALMALVSGSVVFHWYERRVDGPMP